MDDKKISLLFKEILKEIGEDINREGLKNTPNRISKMYKEIFRGYDSSQKPNITVFNNGNDGIEYDQMICDTGSFTSFCEHHVISFTGYYYFGVIYAPKGKILGLSKVGRIVDYCSAKLQIQERLVNEIVSELWNALSFNTDNPPIGMGLVLEAEHLCKSIRGVKKKGIMRTTKLVGAIKNDPASRNEFLSWVNSSISRGDK